MNFKDFRLQCVRRVLLLAATMGLAFYLVLDTEFWMAFFALALASAYQVWRLIAYVERTNRSLSHFFAAVRQGDFSQHFDSAKLGGSFAELGDEINQVLAAFRDTRAEKEEQAQYLQTVVQHISIGLIAFDQDGAIDLVNTAAKRLLGQSQLRALDDIEDRSLGQALRRLRPGQNALLRLSHNNRSLQVVVYATGFHRRGREYVLVSMQDIQRELEEQEMRSWQDLIRVLTHEIMNSITPISSLATTANQLAAGDLAAPGNLADVRAALDTIQRRSAGLLGFVENYRTLTRLPTPAFAQVPLRALLERVGTLLRPQLDAASIQLHLDVQPPSLERTADANLLEQVLINLISNAIEALNGVKDGRIELKAFWDAAGLVAVEVADNGPGLLPEVADKAFIPFFTTKPKGSGIGLSLCRQILRLHKGRIGTRPQQGGGAVFWLRF